MSPAVSILARGRMIYHSSPNTLYVLNLRIYVLNKADELTLYFAAS
jgi:hypothetical protein